MALLTDDEVRAIVDAVNNKNAEKGPKEVVVREATDDFVKAIIDLAGDNKEAAALLGIAASGILGATAAAYLAAGLPGGAAEVAVVYAEDIDIPMRTSRALVEAMMSATKKE